MYLYIFEHIFVPISRAPFSPHFLFSCFLLCNCLFIFVPSTLYAAHLLLCLYTQPPTRLPAPLGRRVRAVPPAPRASPHHCGGSQQRRFRLREQIRGARIGGVLPVLWHESAVDHESVTGRARGVDQADYVHGWGKSRGVMFLDIPRLSFLSVSFLP